MPRFVATLCASLLFLVGACDHALYPLDYTGDADSVMAGDAGDRAWSQDGALDAYVADVVSEASVDARVDGQTTGPQASGPWRRPHVDYPSPGSTASLRLSELGLYRDMESKQLAPDLLAYEPRHELWSDGAQKRRWMYLPEGAAIDTTDPDHWLFPEGSLFFKEFASEDGRRLETRVLARIGPSASDVFFGAFVWLTDEADAVLVTAGSSNVRGTQHDIPTQKNCGTCHRGEAGRVLGFSAVQRPIVASTTFVVPGAPYEIPGTSIARAALGYLHANCGHCHNDDGTARKDTRLTLRLSVHDVIAEQTTIERNTIGVRTDRFTADTGAEGQRVSAGSTADSIVVLRMKVRGVTTQMPSLGTERADYEGIRLIERWIGALVTGAESTR